MPKECIVSHTWGGKYSEIFTYLAKSTKVYLNDRSLQSFRRRRFRDGTVVIYECDE